MDIKIPDGQTLLDFQVEAVQKMLTFLKGNGAAYNSCEMGLGKSVQAVAVLNSLDVDRVLIVCPSVMMLTWQNEVKKWSTLPRLKVQVATKSSEFRNFKDFNILITSYALVAKKQNAELLGSIKWHALVLDEIHYTKSRRAIRTQMVYKHLWPSCRYKIGLSGTPFTAAITDAYTAFSHMAPKEFPNFFEFAKEYAYQKATPWGIKYFGLKNGEKLSKIIRDKFFIRYTKSQVLTSLPPKVFKRVLLGAEYGVKFPKNEEELLKLEVQAVLSKLSGNESVSAVPKTLAGERRQQGLLKVKPVVEYVEDMLEQGFPIVLFAYHRDVIDLYSRMLSGHKHDTITGATSMVDRNTAVERFQNGSTNLIICNLVAGGVGITLTRSSNVVLGEMDWSPSNVSQAVDRTHRIGQKDSVTVHYFEVQNSIDEKISGVLVDKIKTFAKVLDKC